MKTNLDKIAKMIAKGESPKEIAARLGLSERTVQRSAKKLRETVNESILIIPDVHIDPAESNDRMDWMGMLIEERRPQKVVCLGDFANIDSLSSFDKGKKSAEGKRYAKDVRATIDAQERMFSHITYDPELYMIGGNHEHRITRAANLDPALADTLSINDLQFEEFGWQCTPYTEILYLDGISFTHHHTSGRMDRPIGGVNQARSILTKKHTSAVQGHSHVWDYAEDITGAGKKIFALVGGCYFEHEVSYASRSEQNTWWRGITILHRVDEDNWDIERISIERMKAMYAK